MVITPSVLNGIIIGLSLIIFMFIWRTVAIWLSSRDGLPQTIGEGMAVIF